MWNFIAIYITIKLVTFLEKICIKGDSSVQDTDSKKDNERIQELLHQMSTEDKLEIQSMLLERERVILSESGEVAS